MSRNYIVYILFWIINKKLYHTINILQGYCNSYICTRACTRACSLQGSYKRHQPLDTVFFSSSSPLFNSLLRVAVNCVYVIKNQGTCFCWHIWGFFYFLQYPRSEWTGKTSRASCVCERAFWKKKTNIFQWSSVVNVLK